MVSGDTHLSESMIRFENEKKKQQCDLQHEAYTENVHGLLRRDAH